MPTAAWTRAVIALAAAIWVLIVFLSGKPLDWTWAKSLGLVAAIVVWILLAYDRWIWKWPGICRLTKRPVLHGTWKAELKTDFPAREHEVIESYIVIDQTYSRLCVRMLFDRSESQSMNGDIVYENGRCTLYYIFRSDKRALERNGNPPSRGGAELRIARRPALRLEGDYWTDEKTRGQMVTVGHSRVTYDTFADAQQGEYE
jgi:hypothetical protein